MAVYIHSVSLISAKYSLCCLLDVTSLTFKYEQFADDVIEYNNYDIINQFPN